MLLTVRPWVDVGSVGTQTLAFLAAQWGAKKLGQLRRPGLYYDFTRYRPLIGNVAGERVVTVPNSTIHCATSDSDWLLVDVMEPHAHGEDFCDAIIDVMRRFEVSEYLMIGAMYGPVPHTRPAVLSGGATDEGLGARMQRLGIRASSYEGPTTILATIPQEVRSLGAATGTLLVQLPAYARLDPDIHGRYALLRTLSDLFDLGFELDRMRREGEQQYDSLEVALAQNPELAGWVRELESVYDRTVGRPAAPEEAPGGEPSQLSPELERFLADMERRFQAPED
ncbi:MAG TPA: PAC2 family protein [Dehalococcoidia bacterium]|nr:PAC2 family protein [Dehalococcoidia bacterium]